MSSSPRTARQTHPYRKAIIIFSILVSLFLLGTVIVLSSVSYYLAFPDGAFLTEDEVPWTGEDLIKALLDPPSVNGTIERRQEWEELKAEDAVMGSETIPQIWDEVDASEVKAEDVSATEDLEDDSDSINLSSEIGSEEAWGIDGMGTGSYWMKDQWDGKVHDTNDWSRLYNVTTRYVAFLVYRIQADMLDLERRFLESSTRPGRMISYQRNGAKHGKSAERECPISE
jgi:hypothetical protein